MQRFVALHTVERLVEELHGSGCAEHKLIALLCGFCLCAVSGHTLQRNDDIVHAESRDDESVGEGACRCWGKRHLHGVLCSLHEHGVVHAEDARLLNSNLSEVGQTGGCDLKGLLMGLASLCLKLREGGRVERCLRRVLLVNGISVDDDALREFGQRRTVDRHYSLVLCHLCRNVRHHDVGLA